MVQPCSASAPLPYPSLLRAHPVPPQQQRRIIPTGYPIELTTALNNGLPESALRLIAEFIPNRAELGQWVSASRDTVEFSRIPLIEARELYEFEMREREREEDRALLMAYGYGNHPYISD